MEDNSILDLFWQRSELAIDAAREKYGPLCRNVAENLLRNREDAEECVNDTWHVLWERIPPERPIKLRAFAARITRNLAIKRLTRRNAQKRAIPTVSFEELDQCIPGGMTPEQQLEGKELTRALEHFLEMLEPEDRHMFLRRYWFFDSIREIAEANGTSVGAVKTRLYRLRNDLKQHLEKEAQIYVR